MFHGWHTQKTPKRIFFSKTREIFWDENKDIKIYIIRRKPPGEGLFSNVNHVLQGLIHSEKNGTYPVVDMQYYSTEYSQVRNSMAKKMLGNTFLTQYLLSI